jgi:hypothetical protein
MSKEKKMLAIMIASKKVLIMPINRHKRVQREVCERKLYEVICLKEKKI